MTRTAGDRIEVKPSNTIYTALVAIALAVVIVGVVVVFMRAATVFPADMGLLK
jgi:hypothetical protein